MAFERGVLVSVRRGEGTVARGWGQGGEEFGTGLQSSREQRLSSFLNELTPTRLSTELDSELPAGASSGQARR